MTPSPHPNHDCVDGYLRTVDRLEPDLHMVDRDAALTSIAISLRLIAVSLERVTGMIEEEAGR